MRAFFKITVRFLLPILLILVGMEYLLRDIPSRFKLQNNYIINKGERVETLILGSSHTQFGLNPDLLEVSAFNLSNKSQTLEIDLALLQAYEKQLPNLRQVVLRLSYATLFEQLSEGKEQWRLKNYERYMDLNLSNDFRHNSEVLSLPFKQNLNHIIDFYIYNEDPLQSTDLGWGTELIRPSQLDLDEQGKNAAKRHTISDYNLLGENISILKDIMSWCKKRQIEVYLVTLPAHRSYVSHLDQKQWEVTMRTAKQISLDYPNCHYYNFLDDQRFETTDFFDGDHLNGKGATKFSIILNTLLSQ